MRLNAIESKILNNRLIDAHGYNNNSNDGNYYDYIQGIIVCRDMFNTINDMLHFLTVNYNKTIIQ